MDDEHITQEKEGGVSPMTSAMRSLAAVYGRLRGEDSARAAKDREAIANLGPRTAPSFREVLADIGEEVARPDVTEAMEATAGRMRAEASSPPKAPPAPAKERDFEGGGGFTYRKMPDGKVMIVKSPKGDLDGLVVGPEGKNARAYAAIVAEMEGKK